MQQTSLKYIGKECINKVCLHYRRLEPIAIRIRTFLVTSFYGAYSEKTKEAKKVMFLTRFEVIHCCFHCQFPSIGIM